jgi:hypothetical protein
MVLRERASAHHPFGWFSVDVAIKWLGERAEPEEVL